MQKNKKITFSITLLVLIAVLLGVLIVILPEGDDGAPVDVVEEKEDETASESIDYISTVESDTIAPVEELPEAEQTAKPIERKIYLIIDDVGNSLSLLESQLKIPVPVTFAVMPGRPFSEESARKIREAGFDVILHQPMEAQGGQNPGTGAILSGMAKEEIYRLLDDNMRGISNINGINNHMGSKVTADRETMNSIMSYLRDKGMFFLDSVTTPDSVAEESAAEAGVPYAKSNVLFLDNDDDKGSVKKAFLSGVEVSGMTGRAIMIGHLKTLSLVEIIEELYPELKKGGYTFHGISTLFAEGGAG